MTFLSTFTTPGVCLGIAAALSLMLLTPTPPHESTAFKAVAILVVGVLIAYAASVR